MNKVFKIRPVGSTDWTANWVLVRFRYHAKPSRHQTEEKPVEPIPNRLNWSKSGVLPVGTVKWKSNNLPLSFFSWQGYRNALNWKRFDMFYVPSLCTAECNIFSGEFLSNVGDLLPISGRFTLSPIFIQSYRHSLISQILCIVVWNCTQARAFQILEAHHITCHSNSD